GATAEFAFTGSDVTWYTLVGPDQGRAAVYVDGISAGSFDDYGPTATYRVARSFSGLAPGGHTIRITVLGTRNAKSTDSKVAVDGFAVGSSTFDTPVVTYGWAQVANASASGRSYLTSDDPG